MLPQKDSLLVLVYLFKYKFIYFNWRLIALQYCIGFAIHQHEFATGVHVFPILNPSPTSLPIPLGYPSAPAPSILYHASNQDWRSISHMIIYMFNVILPNHPTLALSHRVQKIVLHVCVFFAAFHTRLSLPFSKFHIYVLVYCIGVFLSGLLHSV